MRHRQRAVLFIAAGAMMAGCSTYSLRELRQTTPTGSPFQKALVKHYMEFAASEEKAYDWPDSWHFADKGLLAAYGKDTEPEPLGDWNLPEDKLPEMEQARARLMAVLTPQIKESRPEQAALAQYYFDCWVEQQEENWQEEDIARCRDGLHDTLDNLGAPGAAIAKTTPVEKEPEEKPTAERESSSAPAPEPAAELEEETPPLVIEAPKVPVKVAEDSDTYIVFFKDREIVLTASGDEVIKEVLETLEDEEEYEVILNGHTDTVGDAKENLMLSEERAQVVKQKLITGGIEAGSIKVFAFGESDTPVKTADEVSEPANRRVEIFLND